MELRLENASVSRGDFRLSGISVSFSEGFHAIIGRSGSGKTTLLMALSGLLKLESGLLSLSGRSITGPDRDIGIIFQHPERQLFAETVFCDVSYGLMCQGTDGSEMEERTAAALRMMDIDESKWHGSPFFLSGGERRRAAIAGILVTDPSVILMDEPSAGLDGPSYEALLDLVLSLRSRGRMVVMVTHDEEAAAIADTVTVMDGGIIRGRGTPEEMITDSGAARISSALGIGRAVSFGSLIDGLEAFLRRQR